MSSKSTAPARAFFRKCDYTTRRETQVKPTTSNAQPSPRNPGTTRHDHHADHGKHGRRRKAPRESEHADHGKHGYHRKAPRESEHADHGKHGYRRKAPPESEHADHGYRPQDAIRTRRP
jgi:hypothetical protein